jgi:hypothetical protein
MEVHREALFKNMDEESQTINAIINDKIKQNATKLAEDHKTIRMRGDDSPQNLDM